MNHRERMLVALNHEQPDRCPMQISFTPEFAARLRRDLGLADEDVHNPHGGGNTYALERAIGEDLLLTSVGWANSYYATEALSKDGVFYTDELYFFGYVVHHACSLRSQTINHAVPALVTQ